MSKIAKYSFIPVKLYKVELYINRLYRYCIGLNNLILNYTERI